MTTLGSSRSENAKHEQVYRAVLDLLTRLPTGGELPSERELCQTHSVSRPTVRRALQQLEQEGRVLGHHGRRRVSAASKIELPLSLSSLADDLRAHGIVPGAKLIEVSRREPNAEDVVRHALGTRGQVLRVERLRLADGEPVALEVLFVSADRFDDISAGLGLGQSFYALLHTAYGIELGSAVETIEATTADVREASLLGIPAGSPVLLLSRRTVDTNGTPIEFVRSLYRSDRFRLVSHLVPSPGPVAPANALRLRSAVPTDAAALARVFIDAWESAYPGILDPDVLGMWEPAATEAWMRNLISADGEQTVVSVDADGVISGFTRFGPDPDEPRLGQVYSVYVDPRRKRQGIGKTMLRHAIASLAAAGFPDASIWLFEANAPAAALYRSLGFDPDGRRRVEAEFRANEIRMVRRGGIPQPTEERAADGR